MKRNRRRTKRMSVVASHTMHVFGVIVVLFAMVIVNMLASSRCTQQQKEIGQKVQILKTLENNRERELARWEGMKTLDRLELALVGLGLNMKYEKPVQIIRMDARGEPYLAQNSVKQARRRQGLDVAANAAGKAELPSARPSVPARVRSSRRVRR